MSKNIIIIWKIKNESLTVVLVVKNSTIHASILPEFENMNVSNVAGCVWFIVLGLGFVFLVRPSLTYASILQIEKLKNEGLAVVQVVKHPTKHASILLNDVKLV